MDFIRKITNSDRKNVKGSLNKYVNLVRLPLEQSTWAEAVRDFERYC